MASIGSMTWGSAPKIGLSAAYSAGTSGYTVSITVDPVTGGSYFGYYIYAEITVGGVTQTIKLKENSPSTWSSAITGSASFSASGSALCSIQIYTNSGRSNATFAATLTGAGTGGGGGGGSSATPTLEAVGVSVPNVQIGNGNTFTVTRPNDDYSFTFSYQFGNGEKTNFTPEVKSSNKTAVEYNWEVPADWAEEIPNSLSESGTLYIAVKYGSTKKLGEKSVQFSAYIPENMAPSLTIKIEPENTDTPISSWGDIYVQSISKARITLEASSAGGATLKSYQINFAGRTYGDVISGSQTEIEAEKTTDIISMSGNLVPSASVIDSRGKKTTFAIPAVQVQAYNIPVIRESESYRSNGVRPAGGKYEEDESGAYEAVKCVANVSDIRDEDGVSRNSLEKRVRWKAVGGTWTGYTTITSDNQGLVGGTLLSDTSYVFEISAIDTIGNERNIVYESSTAAVAFHLRDGGHGAGFGRYADADELQCAWPVHFFDDVEVGTSANAADLAVHGAVSASELTIGNKALLDLVYPVGAVYISTVGTSPGTLFGGTWEAIEGQFLLAQKPNEYEPGNTGGNTTAEVELPSHAHDMEIEANVDVTGISGSGYTAYGTASHKHSVATAVIVQGTGTSVTVGGSAKTYDSDDTSHRHSFSFSGGTGYGTATIDDSTGISPAVSNTVSIMPPYLTVYMWKRTA